MFWATTSPLITAPNGHYEYITAIILPEIQGEVPNYEITSKITFSDEKHVHSKCYKIVDHR